MTYLLTLLQIMPPPVDAGGEAKFLAIMAGLVALATMLSRLLGMVLDRALPSKRREAGLASETHGAAKSAAVSADEAAKVMLRVAQEVSASLSGLPLAFSRMEAVHRTLCEPDSSGMTSQRRNTQELSEQVRRVRQELKEIDERQERMERALEKLARLPAAIRLLAQSVGARPSDIFPVVAAAEDD